MLFVNNESFTTDSCIKKEQLKIKKFVFNIYSKIYCTLKFNNAQYMHEKKITKHSTSQF
jgi:hypothetical protein